MKTLTILILICLTLCCIKTTSAQWVSYNTSLNETIYTSSFINAQTGWAAGRNGMYIKTTNGGANWISSPWTSNDILGLHFMNESTGIALEDHTKKTTDGGSNWTDCSFDISPVLNYSVDFTDNNTGWICGMFGYIYKSTNGGTNWIKQNSGTSSDLLSLDFIDSNTGWACGENGTILRTTNGGVNWISVTGVTSLNMNSISFASSANGLAAGANGALFSTTNGGINWTSSSPSASTFYNVFYLPGTSGAWAAGEFPGVYCTTNNGLNWSLQNTGLNSSTVVNFFGASIGFIGDIFGNLATTATGGFNLSAPTNLTATPLSTILIRLQWQDHSIEETFQIERSTDGSSWITLVEAPINTQTHVTSGIYNTDYYYRVRAKSLIFTGAYSNTVVGRPLLYTPSNSSPVNDTMVTTNTPILSWSSALGATGYNCQIATDTGFTNVVNTSTNIADTSLTVTSGILQNSTRYYWRAKGINSATFSNYSARTSFIFQDPNYGHNLSTGNNLYYFANSTSGANLSPSKPTYNWRDTTGSTDLVLNRTAIAPLAAGNLNNGRFDLIGQLPIGNSIKFFGVNYQDFYIGTNGIIGFNAFTPTGADFVEPASSLPQANITNAIFPLWYNTNFQDTDVPLNRLCYKVTASELIVTFSKVPSNGADANDYVSFQVIVSHSVSPTSNSQITLQYNFDETGSTFLSRYNANTLTSHMIGIQGANSSSECFQYRYLNSTPQLITTGPMFGSNLALAFGPDAALLPVELSSFTSIVNGNDVKLYWTTVNEQNNSGFDIERKNSGSREWKKISFVQGNGTTNESQNYSYEDRNITSGKYQYRLKQIDFNGNYEYHSLANEVEIGVPKKFNLSQNYPNPFNPVTKINFELPRNSNVKLSIYDITGKLASELVNEQRAAGYYTVEFNGSNLASGMYFYTIQAGDFSATKKMVLVK